MGASIDEESASRGVGTTGPGAVFSAGTRRCGPVRDGMKPRPADSVAPPLEDGSRNAAAGPPWGRRGARGIPRRRRVRGRGAPARGLVLGPRRRNPRRPPCPPRVRNGSVRPCGSGRLHQGPADAGCARTASTVASGPGESRDGRRPADAQDSRDAVDPRRVRVPTAANGRDDPGRGRSWIRRFDSGNRGGRRDAKSLLTFEGRGGPVIVARKRARRSTRPSPNSTGILKCPD